MKFRIRYGLGGGFGGCGEWEEIEANSFEEAQNEAYLQAVDVYESYAGFHGLRDIDQIMEDEDCSEKVAEEIFNEEMESWLDYEVEEL